MCDVYYHNIPGYDVPFEYKIKKYIIVSDKNKVDVHNMIKTDPDTLWKNYIYYKSLLMSKRDIEYPPLIKPHIPDCKRDVYYELVNIFKTTKDTKTKCSLYLVLSQFSSVENRFVYGDYKINPQSFIKSHNYLMELHNLFNSLKCEFRTDIKQLSNMMIQVPNTIKNKLEYLDFELYNQDEKYILFFKRK
jgi:hypothetical protein